VSFEFYQFSAFLSVSFLLCLLSAFLCLSFKNFLHFSLYLSDCTVLIWFTSLTICISLCVFLTLSYYLHFSFCHSYHFLTICIFLCFFLTLSCYLHFSFFHSYPFLTICIFICVFLTLSCYLNFSFCLSYFPDYLLFSLCLSYFVLLFSFFSFYLSYFPDYLHFFLCLSFFIAEGRIARYEMFSRQLETNLSHTSQHKNPSACLTLHYIRNLFVFPQLKDAVVRASSRKEPISGAVRHVTGNDKDYLRKIPRVVW
jgi:hypothetical protein